MAEDWSSQKFWEILISSILKENKQVSPIMGYFKVFLKKIWLEYDQNESSYVILISFAEPWSGKIFMLKL